MDFNPPTNPDNTGASPNFDIQGFKDLLETLKKSKETQEDKAQPVYEPEE